LHDLDEPIDPRTADAETPAALPPSIRRGGTALGRAVHAVLATVDLDADAAAVAAATALQARLLGSASDEVAAAPAVVLAALAPPLIRRAAAAARVGRCRREVAMALRLDDGTLVEGVADLAFREDDATAGWTVVDFKTDLSVAGRVDEYRRQLAVYAEAVARATALPTRAVVLQV
jgi:ATP-dependent exoDNAse (exonuclease V) beta subunit